MNLKPSFTQTRTCGSSNLVGKKKIGLMILNYRGYKTSLSHQDFSSQSMKKQRKIWESENDKSRKGSRSRSLSDLVLTVETPFLTPLDSPSYFTPPLTPRDSSYSENGFNPLFESSSDADFNRIRSSPPPNSSF
ncbi:hypothetical protein LguiB_036331 [Lonicera macranthoides]